jgi:hypothetical protein
MNYIFEAICVGLYTSAIYLFFHYFIKNIYILLLVVGFCKHFISNTFRIHTYYCNYGEACIKVNRQNKLYISTSQYIVYDSIMESILFLFFGLWLSIVLTNIYLFFTLGFILHILFEN